MLGQLAVVYGFGAIVTPVLKSWYHPLNQLAPVSALV